MSFWATNPLGGRGLDRTCGHCGEVRASESPWLGNGPGVCSGLARAAIQCLPSTNAPDRRASGILPFVR